MYKPKKSYIYLAGQYWNDDYLIRKQNEKNLGDFATALLLEGCPVYSPINMGVSMQESLPEENKALLDNPEVWQTNEEPMIRNCEYLLIMTTPGWEKSAGVAREMELAKKYKKNIYFACYDFESEIRPFLNILKSEKKKPTNKIIEAIKNEWYYFSHVYLHKNLCNVICYGFGVGLYLSLFQVTDQLWLAIILSIMIALGVMPLFDCAKKYVEEVDLRLKEQEEFIAELDRQFNEMLETNKKEKENV